MDSNTQLPDPRSLAVDVAVFYAELLKQGIPQQQAAQMAGTYIQWVIFTASTAANQRPREPWEGI